MMSFGKNQHGAVAVIIAFVLPLVIAAAGLGYDYTRISAASSDLEHSVDAISQQITEEIKACLDQQRTLQTGALQQDLDPYCLNDASF